MRFLVGVKMPCSSAPDALLCKITRRCRRTLRAAERHSVRPTIVDMLRIFSVLVLCSLCQCAGIERGAGVVPSGSSEWGGEYWAGQIGRRSLSLNSDGTYEARHRSCSYSTTWGQGEWVEIDGWIELVPSDGEGSNPQFDGRYCQEDIDGVKILVPSRFVDSDLPVEDLIMLGFVGGDIETVQELQNEAWEKLKPRLRELRLMQRSNQALQTDAQARS